MADKREFLFSFLGRETVSPAAKRAGDAVETMGDRMSDAQRDAKRLDDQIAEVEASLKDLARQYAATGDEQFVKRIREQERELRKLNKVQVHLKDLIDVDTAGVTDIGVQVGARIGPIMVQSLGRAVAAAGPGIAIGAPILAGVAAWLGSTAAGAALAGGAAAAVAGGLVLAAKDQRVQAAGRELLSGIGAQLEDAAMPFVPAALRGIDTLRAGFRDLDDEIEDIFDDAAGYVPVFARAVTGALKQLAPGFRDLVDAAEPVVRMLETELPELAGDLGRAFSAFSEHAEEGAVALGYFLDVAGAGVQTLATSVAGLAELFKWIDLVGAARVGNYAHFARYAEAAEDASSATGGWADMLKALAVESDTATYEIKSLSDAIGEIVDKNLSLAEAELAAQQAIADVTKAIRENGKSTNEASQTYRDNREQLLRLATAFNRETEAADASGQSSEQAAAMHLRHEQALYAAARAAGYTEAQARDLTNQWLKVPKHINTRVTQTGVEAVKRAIAGIPRDVAVAVRVTGNTNVSAVAAALRKNQRWGGIDYAMARGGAIEAHYATSPTVLYGERETGGEAFIPRRGDRARSLRILETAASWYGADVVTRGGGMPAPAGTGVGIVRHEVTLRWPDGATAGRIVIDGFGANPTGTMGAVRGASRRTGVRL